MKQIKTIENLIFNNKRREKISKKTGDKVVCPSPNDIRETWGLDILGFETIKGRELPMPTISFRGGSIFILI